MTLKATYGIAIPSIAVVVLLLPTAAVNVIYHGYIEIGQATQWVLPIIMAIISFTLLWDWVKALIAGAVSFGITLFMLFIIGVGALDCGSETVPLSRSCVDPPLMFVKVGLAGLICLNLFLLYRIAFPKPPKTPRSVQAK